MKSRSPNQPHTSSDFKQLLNSSKNRAYTVEGIPPSLDTYKLGERYYVSARSLGAHLHLSATNYTRNLRKSFDGPFYKLYTRHFRHPLVVVANYDAAIIIRNQADFGNTHAQALLEHLPNPAV